MGTCLADEYVLCFEVSMIDTLIVEVGASADELPHHGKCLGFGYVAILLEEDF